MIEFDDLADDVIGVLRRGLMEVVFFVVPASAIEGKDFDLLVWTDSTVSIGVSADYLDGPLRDMVAEAILERGHGSSDSWEEHAMELFVMHLSDILNEVMHRSFDKWSYLNLDSGLKRILGEH